MVARWGEAVGHLHWGWDVWWRDGGWRVASPPNSPQHLTWQDALSQLPRPPDTVFAVVRDPVARMASEHRWQRRGRRGTRAGKLLARLPFPVWLRLMIAVAGRNPHAFDNHFRPQAEFVPTDAFVFHLENGLERVENWLVQTLGVLKGNTSIPHAIPSGNAKPVGAAEQALIARHFGIDYARFGYPRPPSHLAGAPLLDAIANALAPAVEWLEKRGRL